MTESTGPSGVNIISSLVIEAGGDEDRHRRIEQGKLSCKRIVGNMGIPVPDGLAGDESFWYQVIQAVRVFLPISEKLKPGVDGDKVIMELAVKVGERLHIANQRATKDALTGLDNRRSLNDFLDTLFEWFADEHNKDTVIAVCFFDIDNFKKFNDQHSHIVGDSMLKACALGLKKHTKRMTDFVARFGGEEVVVVLNMSKSALQKSGNLGDSLNVKIKTRAERLRQSVVDGLVVETVEGTRLTSTVSMGLVVLEQGKHRLEDVLHRGSQALDEAKRQGKNRTVAEWDLPEAGGEGAD